MKRYLLKISFDGTNYHGWQRQPNGITVQEVLEDKISDIVKSKTVVHGCSRTDAGVHAKEFYCHFDVSDNIPKTAFTLGLNSCLPDDISVLDCIEVGSDFHARFNALGKRYTYRFYFGNKNPFYDRYALRLETKPDINKMNEFCNLVVGEHDFYGFSSSKRSVTDTVRTVSECNVSFNGDFLEFNITADGFLYNMVRILAGTSLFVGYRKLDADVSNKIFFNKDRSLGGDTLVAKGLTLSEVFYDLR